MKSYKVVFLGPVGAGKTTAVKAITDNRSVVTDVPTSDIAAVRKGTTTVAMDYGTVIIDDQTKFHIHGCPGQKRFDFMWPIVTQGAYGLVLLIDNARNFPQKDLKEYITAVYNHVFHTRLIVGITRTDVSETPPISTYYQWLRELGVNAEVMKVDARNKGDMLLLLGRLMTTEAGHAHSTFEGDGDTEVQSEMDINNSFLEADMVKFNDSSLAEVSSISGVTGATLATSMGDLLKSTIDDAVVNEFIAFVSGVAPSLESMVDMGKAKKIMLKSQTEDSLTAVVGTEHVLGIRSKRNMSLSLLGQQIEDAVQWMDQ